MIFAVTRDITDQKRSSEQLLIRNSAVESSMSAIGLANAQGTMFYVNSAFLKLWGFKSFDEVIGKSMIDFSISAEKIEKVVAVMKSGNDFVGEDKSNRNDGTAFDFELRTNMVRSENGDPSARWCLL